MYLRNKIYATLLVLASGLSFGATSTLINGAGATFPYPLYSKWFHEYGKANPSAQINYQSIGSGGGIRQFLEKTVDFGASDAPMTDEQMAKSAVPVLHIPTVLGAVVVTYNIPGVETGLKLTPDVLADIFLGKVTKWNDPRIAKNNPSAKLAGDILVVRRSDGSGTTHIFTDYLSKVSPDFKAKVGNGTAVNWPTGLGGKGNEGVAGLIKQTQGSIGYIELIYAENNKLPYAALENSSKAFVLPTMDAVTAAADGALKTIPEDFRVSITNPPGKKSYPLSAFTYLLVYKTQDDAVKGPEIVKLLKWTVKEGQTFAKDMRYAPLPTTLVKKIEAKIATIETKKVKVN